MCVHCSLVTSSFDLTNGFRRILRTHIHEWVVSRIVQSLPHHTNMSSWVKNKSIKRTLLPEEKEGGNEGGANIKSK